MGSLSSKLPSGGAEASRNRLDPVLNSASSDDLSREVYCILGIPIDAIEMSEVLRIIEIAAANAEPFVISTPNLNFLVNSLQNAEFRESLLLSDLCTADGMPIVWIARLMGIPIKRRTAGSDIFAALKTRPLSTPPIKIFLFGSTEGVAAAAAKTLNAGSTSMSCVGWACPGFGTLDDLSQEQFIEEINSSKADFLVVALGAEKGQLWLLRNHHHLRIPVRAHLGVTIHFQAGSIKRAPVALQKLGLEWLWRIKQEPHLWKRYWHDGLVLLRLMLTRVLPLAIKERLLRRRCSRQGHNLVIEEVQSPTSVTLRLSGFAVANHVAEAIRSFGDVLAAKKPVVIDFSRTRAIDARFLGFLLMVRKELNARGMGLQFAGISPKLEKTFRLNGVGYLLPAGACA